MAQTREQMKEAVRASGLGVMDPAEYDAELREYITRTGASMTEIAAIGLELFAEL